MTTDPSPGDVRRVLAEFLGWRWWRYVWRARGADAVVRSLQPPGWPDEAWFRWGQVNGLAPADGTEPPHVPDGHISTLLTAGPPDPASDLNAMAAVESALRARGLGSAYLWHLTQIANGRPPDGGGAADTWDAPDLLAVVTAPAAARALAAWRVLKSDGGN